ncbi:hypothetical protein RhiirA5_495579 [Rhizophagus irregularis]|uniref:F-box domain-containing protein n=3 Tax=Rhizophagus irregularis TaxID=588596 RepID=A0A2I1F4X5_9GLOM|nr:hypothetical protein GLOIN_2v1782257 [Rhizophagus irregularis DAOM 181602=DAOM 197198]EXX58063.1 hypothetical protein RirG_201270 [Rhizophagus irregularis DAOM 197198w]PKC14218.1 hypothetical protein RhiirA5_495579 [Rhizophagus irregularis]PKC59245.1 hypothetical protein RhiirA1_540601 [Rhizophagus irregularis]PKY29419.1 hypothetical protein RhiirB3_530482 [Rhizophagus irregularis]POG64980.1 hypothetical protein GLOIN_2v1782257 [Rhizophagus irregularis DAOM 181602=DAOM 197198]|eukprot:XP_025171846.1 hypothetical protein GLOIN_2v1782257 [Rhizophagus irregularis DAOM 181602=DAOM 197198]
MTENKANIITILDPAYSECYEIIMKPLKDDIITLYSCILVNRSFCRVFIPVLWRNPFKFIKDDNKLIKLINTLIHCLNQTIKNDLINKDSIKLEGLPTYFKYHTLIKEFDLNPLQRGIRLWTSSHLTQKLTRRSISRRVFKINKYIGNLLFDKENQYDSLNIYHNELLNGLRTLFDICKFDNYEKSLVQVNKLSVGFFHGNTTNLILPITENFLKLQNKLSPNIQHLQISIDTIKEHEEFSRNLIHFIKSQKKLKSLITNTFWIKDDFIQPFLNSLKNQSTCLTFLKLQDQKLSNELLLSILKSLPNLITLYLDINYLEYHVNEGNSFYSIISQIYFNNLENLYYDLKSKIFWNTWNVWSSIPDPDPSNLLFNQILLSSSKLFSIKVKINNGFIKYLQSYQHQHLTHLHIILDSDSLENLIKLLKNLRHLIYLKLDDYYERSKDRLLRYNYYTFLQFAQTIPNSLRIFEINFEITNGYLETLFNETQLNIQCIKLYHYIHCNTSLRVFIDYAKSKKCFKELGITYNIMKSISKDYIIEAKNYFNVTPFNNDEINIPFYDDPIKNSYWSRRVSEGRV